MGRTDDDMADQKEPQCTCAPDEQDECCPLHGRDLAWCWGEDETGYPVLRIRTRGGCHVATVDFIPDETDDAEQWAKRIVHACNDYQRLSDVAQRQAAEIVVGRRENRRLRDERDAARRQNDELAARLAQCCYDQQKDGSVMTSYEEGWDAACDACAESVADAVSALAALDEHIGDGS